MKLLRLQLLASLVLLFAVGVHANTIPPPDPQIIIFSTTDLGTTSVQGLSFSFQANGQGLGSFQFLNISNQDWFNLAITTQTPPGGCAAISASSGLFALFNCVSDTGSGLTTMTFFGVAPQFPNFPGILNNAEFVISLGTNPNLAWAANQPFTAVANVPEPATIALFLTGIGALVVRRKFRKPHVSGA